jgi:uncharacterized protein (DUF2461 family)
MSEMPPFPGFPVEGLGFLEELAHNNNREWFEAHKADYRSYVLEPAQAFVVALGERLKLLSPEIAYDTRTNGSGSIMRIYRDLRFSKDKGMHGFPKSVLTAYQEAVADDVRGAELEAALETLRSAGVYEIGGERYKRVPRGYDPDHARADLLHYKGLHVRSPQIEAPVLTTPELVEVCFEHCRAMAPLHHWLVGVNQAA